MTGKLKKVGAVLSMLLPMAAGPAAAQSSNPITIGVLTPLSGTYAPMATEVMNRALVTPRNRTPNRVPGSSATLVTSGLR